MSYNPQNVEWRRLHGNAFDSACVLVTGAAGFIGSHLVETLLILGANVIALDDLSMGSERNFDAFRTRSGSNFKFVHGSILDRPLLDRLISQCNGGVVFHEAAWGSVPRSVEMPERYHEINTTGTLNVLESARQSGARRVVFAASSSAYGDTPTLPKVETMPVRPKSPYAASKVAGEALMRAYASSYEIDTASLRYFNIFGPRQNANSAYAAVIAAFAKALLNGNQPVVFGDGEQSRDFTFVANAVHANLLAARSEARLGGDVFNVACGRRVTVNELFNELAALIGNGSVKLNYLAPRKGDVLHSLADLEHIRKHLGYEPIIDLESGLKETAEWYKSSLGTSESGA